MTKMEKVNEKITNQILALLAKGVAPWKKGWNGTGTGVAPFNLNSGRKYAGHFNSLMLAISAGGRLPAYAPFSKANPAKKGSKAILIFQPMISSKEVNGVKKSQFFGFKTIPVFHYTDLQGIDVEALEAKYAPKSDEDSPVFNPIEICESVIKEMPNAPSIANNGGDRAFYSPANDSISLPKPEDFFSSNEYYATLFHEVGHSTGHFTRLDRKDGMENIKFGSHDYSFEELVAELTSCFVGSYCGIMEDANLENSTAYLQSWIKKLQSNPDWIIKASSLANKASAYILNKNKQEA